MFSGGGVFDHHNLTGLQTNPNVPTLILVPTLAVWKTRKQDIWIVYSNDAPKYVKFEYYKKNPIVEGPPSSEKITTFRDMQILKQEDHYISLISRYNRTLFYQSRNLLDWEYLSEFGEFDGAHTGVWECPAIVPFDVSLGKG